MLLSGLANPFFSCPKATILPQNAINFLLVVSLIQLRLCLHQHGEWQETPLPEVGVEVILTAQGICIAALHAGKCDSYYEGSRFIHSKILYFWSFYSCLEIETLVTQNFWMRWSLVFPAWKGMWIWPLCPMALIVRLGLPSVPLSEKYKDPSSHTGFLLGGGGQS